MILLLSGLPAVAHYLLTTLPGLIFFALGEHELKVGPGGRGQHVVQVQQLLGLNAVAHYLLTTLPGLTFFALGCGEPVPKKDWTDSAHN